MIVKVNKSKGYAESPEKSKKVSHTDKISVLYVNGLYSLSVGRWWMVENKKTLRSINKWLETHGYETRFEEEK